MPIPDYESLMLPLLRYAEDRCEHSIRDAIDRLASEFDLTQEERRALLPSGQQATFDNRVGWARTYMTKAGLLRSPRRGFFTITDRGLDVLREQTDRIDVPYLTRYPEFMEFRSRRRTRPVQTAAEIASDTSTPIELLEEAYHGLRAELTEQVLEAIRTCTPGFFERLVVDVLLAMGYGGSRADAGRAVGRSGDEGIDGIVKEDKLGLDTIYLQAKRWQNPVGRPEVQRFAGALQGHHAKKGILITTSTFTDEARDFAVRVDTKVVLVDGQQLAQMMIDYNVGVTQTASYDIKRIDSDYFSEE